MFFQHHSHHPDLHSFPTRRSSDLKGTGLVGGTIKAKLLRSDLETVLRDGFFPVVSSNDLPQRQRRVGAVAQQDRKSTRLNSSHGYISYAVFCLKKKKHKNEVKYSY